YFKGLCVLGGGVVDLKWSNKNIETATLTATVNHEFKLKLPDNRIPKFYKNGIQIMLKQKANGYISFSLNKDESIDLKY
ncbi:MAG: glycoside hydrolase family 95-like protein, partial [Paludibacter sp.]